MLPPFSLRRFPPLMYACALRLKCAAGEDDEAEEVVNTFFPLRFFSTVFLPLPTYSDVR